MAKKVTKATSRGRQPSNASARAVGSRNSIAPKAGRAPTKVATSSSVGWQSEKLAEVRRIIHDADPEIVEEFKWKKATNPEGVPVWSHAGIVCTGETYKHVVKLTFARGASLDDPAGLFNSSLEGNTRRAIDIQEKDAINAKALKALIRAAVAENLRTSKTSPSSKETKGARPGNGKVQPVKLLSGDNPQIAKADGDAPVQAYIAAIPGWKRDVSKRLDAIIVKNVPNVRKAVKWNSPFYGIEGQGWFLSFHMFTHYVKVAFFRGTSLTPVPPDTSKDPNTRYLNIREGAALDEKQLASWIKQAAALPGWMT